LFEDRNAVRKARRANDHRANKHWQRVEAVVIFSGYRDVASSVSPKSVALAAGAAWTSASPAIANKISGIFFKSVPSDFHP
jgi:hypothetical protein